jgi:hypothetical protein
MIPATFSINTIGGREARIVFNAAQKGLAFASWKKRLFERSVLNGWHGKPHTYT